MEMFLTPFGSSYGERDRETERGREQVTNFVTGWKSVNRVFCLFSSIGLVAAMMCSIILSILYECMNYVYHVYHLRAERW